MEFHFKAISIYHHLVFYSEIEDDIFEMACNRYLKVVPKVIHIGLTVSTGNSPKFSLRVKVDFELSNDQ